MLDIYINKKLVEIYSNETIVMSYGASNLFDINNVTGVYSNTFKIPATNANNLLFENANNILAITDLPYKRLDCELYDNGLLVLVGFASIISSNKFEYEILIVGGNGNWLDKVGDSNLQSVLLGCEYTHYWNLDTVYNSRVNTWDDVYIYPNIDYGDLFFATGNNANYYDLYPSVFCKYLFNKIFKNIGLTINSDWFDNNTLFEKQILPFSAEFLRDKDFANRNYFKATFITDQTTPDNSLFFLSAGVTNTYATTITKCYNFLSSQDWVHEFSPPNVPNDVFWLVIDSGKATINYNLTVERISAMNPFLSRLHIGYYDINGVQSSHVIANLGASPLGVYNFTGSVEIEVGRGALFLIIGDLELKANSTFEFSLLPNDTDAGELEIDTTYNWLTLGSTLPNIPITDFINTISKQYGLIFQEDASTGIINIFQFDKILNNVIKAIDWSDKIDLTEQPTITYNNDSLATQNWFKYATDGADEYLTRQQGFADFYIEIKNITNLETQDLFTSVFAPVLRLMSFSNTIELAYIPYLEGSGVNSLTPRMAYVEQDNSAILEITGKPIEAIQPNVYFEDLSFKNLIPKYYKNFEAILNNNKQVSCLIKLNSLDINKLDFSNPVFIEYFGAWFYLNLINQYNLTSPSSVEVQLFLIQ